MRKTHYGIAVLCTAVLAMDAGDLKGQGSPQITLLQEFRPIGGSGNNLQNSNLDPVPGAPEIALAPLNFAGPNDRLINATNPRTISNAICGGTGANGQNAETTDPTLSAWLYVFGQFVDHDLDLEETPLTTADISIVVPTDPVFPPNTVIQMTRDVRNPTTNTIVNTTAGYLDLSQLYGSDIATAASLRNSDGTLKTSDGGQALPVVNDQFVTGDPRVMENPELSAVTILFMREHNFWISQLKAESYRQPSKASMAQSIRSTYSWEASLKRMLLEPPLVQPFKRSSLSSFKLCEQAIAFSGPVRGSTGELPS